MTDKVYGMIFAAGLGTRLAPFTAHHPKALVPVGGVPMLERTIKRFIQAGITDIVVNVHHFTSQVVDFLNENGKFGANIMISREDDRLLDTGGGLVKAARFFEGCSAVLVHNADILTDVDLKAFIEAHSNSDSEATLLVSDRASSRRLYFDENMYLKGWENLKTGQVRPTGFKREGLTGLSFGGIHVLSPKIFSWLKDYGKGEPFSLVPFYVDMCNRLSIKGYVAEKPYMWFDVGSPEKLNEAETRVNELKS